jgi:hypothetical protein
MNSTLKSFCYFAISISVLVCVGSCKSDTNSTSKTPNVVLAALTTENIKPAFKPSKSFNTYWYTGEAEITSYTLEQLRYGELRKGSAVLVFVTEDFLPNEQVKADNYSKDNTSVLKLNATKNFNTGIYPYSIMQSTFYPIANNAHAIKITASVQEWCGQVYTQINNRTTFEVQSHSYFQSEADQEFTLNKAISENQLWTQLRIDPKSLPVGELQIIPSLEYIQLNHIQLKTYKAIAHLKNGSYTIYYPDLNRHLEITFSINFPYTILGWEDTSNNGYGEDAKTLTTKATQLKTLKSAYWTKNSNADEPLREILQLQ